MYRIAALSLIAALALPIAAEANEPRLQATFGDWQTYTRVEGGQRICYVLTKPKSKSPGNVNHGDVYFMVASWQSGAATEQPSLLAGYPLKTINPPTARVGNTRVPMYVSQNEAFVESDNDERRLVRSMRKGSTMRVEAVSQRGTATSYSFSLKGITAALGRAQDACR